MIEQHNLNASLQLVPIDEPERAMPLIDEAIGLLRQSGLPMEVGPFGTSIEGPYHQVMQLVQQLNEYMLQHSRHDWLLNLQLHLHPTQAVSMHAKTSKHR
ncbi:MAG: thiamine-binding protein [Chitinophagaceae bacterium]|jgi:uncharacterized protein YqgV (UPF0045/DUF77 family)|nr:thiamine-binding protein [Chitinophagaceae bacterium]